VATGDGIAKPGGARPIIVPLRWREPAPGGAAAGGGVMPVGDGAGGGSGGSMSNVPPKAGGGAEGNGLPQELQSACWSEFCVPHWPHCFIAGRL